MGRAPCCSKVGMHRGPWTPREDALLTSYIQCNGEGDWRNLPKNAGLLRCGKSCRLRWVNYLRPDIKRGNIGPEEEDLIIRLHALLGNRWSLIAGRLPGRTDNEIKNYWNSHLSKRLQIQGLDLREGSSTYKHTKPAAQKKGGTNKRKNPKKSKRRGKTDTEETTTRNKILTPKPTRITSILRGSNVMEVSEGSDKTGTTTYDASVENLDIDWSNVSEGDLVVRDDPFASQDNLLERLYEEYSQLLSSDIGDQLQMIPYTESLWV